MKAVIHIKDYMMQIYIKGRLKEMEKSYLINKAIYILQNENEFLHYDYRDNMLSDGIPSRILLLSGLKTFITRHEYNAMKEKYIKLLIESLENHGLYNFSIFSGTCGVGISIYSISENGKLYKNLLKNINLILIEQIDEFFKTVSIDDLKIVDYDFISGITGITQYLMLWKNDKIMSGYLYKCLKFLTDSILKNKKIDDRLLPNIFITAENQMTKEEANLIPNGAINTGIAHGIAGVGIALSLAYSRGIYIDGLEDAIKKIITFFKNNQIKDKEKIYWSNNIELNSVVGNAEDFIRDAWCYGTPGISLFFLYAGIALNDKSCITFANKAFCNSVNNTKGIFSPILCHGFAGLLTISNEFYRNTNDIRFKQISKNLYYKVLNYFDGNYAYGFRDYDSNEDFEGKDNIGILDGVIGIYLSLLSMEKSDNFWTKVLLFE